MTEGGKMEYRELGKTGKKVSVIGLGGEYVDTKPYEQVKSVIDASLDNGINIIDVFMPGTEIRTNLAKALGDKRDKMMIQGHMGSTDIDQQYNISRDFSTVKKYFEELLDIFGGFVEFGMLYFIDSEKDFQNVFETELADYAARLKAQGKIGHIGFSSHNPETAIRAINTGLPEMFLFSVNPAFDMLPSDEYTMDHLEHGFKPELLTGIEPKRAELYKLCEQKQIGITVMKTYCAGKLLSPDHTPFSRAMTEVECISYALSRPSVASVLIGCKDTAEIEAAMAYLSASEAEKDYTDIIGTMRSDFSGNCVYCSHCQPCPVKIDIAAVMKYLDIAKLDEKNIPPSVISHYMELASGGGNCTECGNCEEKCPFAVPIIANMAEAEKLFNP